MDAFGRRKGDPDYDASSETDQMGADTTLPVDPAQAPKSTTQVQPTAAPIPARPAPVAGAVYNSDTETPEQLVARYGTDYHSSDAASVDKQLAAWLKNPGAGATTTPAPANNNFATPEGQLAWLTPRLASAGFGGQEAYWQKRIGETGGGWNDPANVAYWEHNISTGQAGRNPGGEFYDPGATGAVSASSTGPYDAQISAQIEKMLADANSPTDENSPVVKNATTAFRNQTSFATDRAREKLAEQAAYSGMGSGAFDTAIQSQLEQGGRDVASFQSTQITSELQRKADELKTALATATGSNAQALQLKLAEIQDQLSRAQLGQQNSQFYDRLGFDIGHESNSLDAELLKYLQAA